MTRPQLHPQARTQLLHALDLALYQKTRIRLRVFLNNIIWDNAMLHGNRQQVLHFKGEIFRADTPDQALPKLINHAHSSIRERLKKYIEDKNTVAAERDMALGYVRLILQETSHACEIRQLLPQALQAAFNPEAINFLQGFGPLYPEDLQRFRDVNQKYLAVMKARLTYNFLDVATV
jgi:hypothetical protein